MMMLGVLCLLLGSTTSSPILKASRSAALAPTNFLPQQFPAFVWSSGRGVSSDPGSSSSLPSLPYPTSDKANELPAPQDTISSAGPSSYSSPVYSSSANTAEGTGYHRGFPSFRDEGYSSPGVSEYGVAYAASQSGGYDGSYGGGYDASASAYEGDSSYGFVVAPQDEELSSGSAPSDGDENPEPVFSDVSDLEPVYSFSSRSSYQRGRAVFAQTRYTPGEPVPPPMPVSRDIHKTYSKQSSPAKVPTKGGF